MSIRKSAGWRVAARLVAYGGVVVAGTVGAQVAPRVDPALAAKIFRHRDLEIPNRLQAGDRLPPEIAADARKQLRDLKVPDGAAFFDRRSGRWAALMPAAELLRPAPGSGPAWQPLRNVAPRSGGASVSDAAWAALVDYLQHNHEALRINVAELAQPTVTVHDGGDRIQIFSERRVDGVPVKDAFLTAVLNHGNLVLLGLRAWGDIDVATKPDISADEATSLVAAHLGAVVGNGLRAEPKLVMVPTAPQRDPMKAAIGGGYRHRLAWRLEPEVTAAPGPWRALVDAHSGELLAFEDGRTWATPRSVVGGVFPLGNDGAPPDGVELDGVPMPYADLTDAGRLAFADSGGNHPLCVDGTVTTSLDGRYIAIDGGCGPVSESSTGGLDLGSGPGTDCDVPVPGTSSAGNTHAARSTYYHLNRIAEQARSHLPDNTWLQDQLTALTDAPDFGLLTTVCNAFWDEETVNFFVSGEAAPGLVCSNTGELAGVVDHEWGHGLDDNDAVPTISSPGEGIADVYAALFLGESCIARGFYLEDNPCGDTDPCTECTGVREIDWAKRESGEPHDLAWIDAECAPPFLGDVGPCGGDIYCESSAYSEAIWDLVHRDLQAAPFAMAPATALEVGTRLTYLAAGAVGSWYECVDGTGEGDGCNADGGYLNFLAVDDDNGNLADGTPHMEAIFAAFDRHGIACGTPAVQNSGCAGSPTTAPVVTASPLDRGASLSWPAVPGAAAYDVFRSDGFAGCGSGKVKVGRTSDTYFVDTGLANGFEYLYIVLPVGGDDACLGPASSCTAVTPAVGANLGFDDSSQTLDILNGDLDAVIDNCERATVRFDLVNPGAVTLSNVRIVGVTVVSHPGTVIVESTLPSPVAAELAPCQRAQAGFTFFAQGLSFDETIEFRVETTGDELEGRTVALDIRLPRSETGLQSLATTTFSFESGLDGWQTTHGTFARSSDGGGAGGSSWYVASSGNLANQCDAVRSPALRLSSSSILSLWTSFDIEPDFDLEGSTFWFDRANVGLVDTTSGSRSLITPDGGRTYNAGGPYGTCGTENQDGWADTALAWAESTWSAHALGAGARAGDFVQLEFRYGTDAEEQGAGFRFDEVTLTDIELLVEDAQADLCVAGNAAPTAGDDATTATGLTPIAVDVLGNDSDPDVGDTLRVLGVSQPAHGRTVVNPVGPGLDTVVYTPGDGPGGPDSFHYSAGDGRGGSAIAAVDVDREFVFVSGFEGGDAAAWSAAAGACDPDGLYTLTSPSSIQYACCLGLVNLQVTSFSLTDDGALAVSAPSNPVALAGTATSCPVGSFNNTGSVAGGCTETYTLDGSFTGPDTWTGTYTVGFTGADCSCFGLDPCVDQTFDVTAMR